MTTALIVKIALCLLVLGGLVVVRGGWKPKLPSLPSFGGSSVGPSLEEQIAFLKAIAKRCPSKEAECEAIAMALAKQHWGT